jgi:hypothetical protein
VDIASGTFKVTSIRDGQISYSGNLHAGTFSNNSGGGGERIALIGMVMHVSNNTNCSIEGTTYQILAQCSTSNDGASNPVSISTWYTAQSSVNIRNFNGVVECSQGGDTTTPQSSSSMTGTTQDGDGDGVPNSSDRCHNTPNPRCFKEAT